MHELVRASAPPPLDLRFLHVPYVPTWDVLRRMCESERVHTTSVEAVLDMGAFYDGDDIEADGHFDFKRPVCTAAATSARVIAIAFSVCLALLLIAAFRVHVPAPQLRFMRERVSHNPDASRARIEKLVGAISAVCVVEEFYAAKGVSFGRCIPVAFFPSQIMVSRTPARALAQRSVV
eukprot:IDg13001t1